MSRRLVVLDSGNRVAVGGRLSLYVIQFFGIVAYVVPALLFAYTIHDDLSYHGDKFDGMAAQIAQYAWIAHSVLLLPFLTLSFIPGIALGARKVLAALSIIVPVLVVAAIAANMTITF